MAKLLTGIVVSASADKTATVSIHRRKNHPLYKKQFSVNTNFLAHDEKNECSVGDKVSIVETKPISAKKKFKVDKIIEKSELSEKDKEVISGEETKEEAKEDKQ